MIQSPPHVSVSMDFLDLVWLVMAMGNETGISMDFLDLVTGPGDRECHRIQPWVDLLSLPVVCFLSRSPPAPRGPEQYVEILSDEEEKETMGRVEDKEKAQGIAGLVTQACKPSYLGR